jgi:hypothetical protein
MTPIKPFCCVQKFSVGWKNTNFLLDVSGDLKMDGNFCSGTILYGHSPTRTVVDYGVNDGTMLKPFVFSSLELTGDYLPFFFVFFFFLIIDHPSDDDAFLGSPSHQGLGLIELTITPIQVIERNVTAHTAPSLSQAKVHERSKKAVTQQITLGRYSHLEIHVLTTTTQAGRTRADGTASVNCESGPHWARSG